MAKFNKLSMILILPTLSFLISCGKSNFNRLFERSDQLEDIDYLVKEAEYAYDQEDFEKAKQLAEKAYNIQPNEQASVLLAYIYLSFAKLDIFQLSSSLSQGESDKKENQDESKTNQLFSLIADSLGLSNSDFIKLSASTFEGDPIIYEPKGLSEARVSDIETLNYIDKAISMLCPFVEDGAKLLNEPKDERHSSPSCEQSQYTGTYSTTGAFAWALAHLGEAITFYSMLLYTGPQENQPNLIARTNKLEQYKDQPVEYLKQIENLIEVIDGVLPTDAEKAKGSMLYGLFSDLQTTNLALEISGAPKQITGKITNVLDEIQKSITDITEITETNAALRDKLIKSIKNKIRNQIEGIEASPEQLEEICKQYETIELNTTSLPSKCLS